MHLPSKTGPDPIAAAAASRNRGARRCLALLALLAACGGQEPPANGGTSQPPARNESAPPSANGGESAWSWYLAPASACPGSADAGAPAAEQIRSVTCLVSYARAQDGRSRLAQSPALTRACARTARTVSTTAVQISSGSCST